MTRSVKVVLAAILLLALYLTPQLAPVHHLALGWMKSSLAEAGYTISYTASSGNLWHGVRLQGSRLYGPGVDVAIAELTIHYTLLALVMRQLPLSVSAAGLSGNMTLAELELPAGGEGGGVRPVLRSAKLSDVALMLTDLPYALPDMRFSEVRIGPAGSAFELAVTVTTANGSAELDGVVSLNPLTIEAEVIRADAMLARHWFDGVTGGSARGHVTVQEGAVEVALDFTDGSIMVAGIEVSELSGRAVMRDLIVQAELSGQALGGAAHGIGTVRILEERWEAAVTGEPSLVAAARWLSVERIPDLTELLGLSGQGSAALSLSGWENVDIRGEAVGSGTLLGEPLTALTATFSSDGAADTQVEVSAQVGDGFVDVILSPYASGFDLALQTRALPLPDGLYADASWQLTQRQTLTSELRAAIGGTVLGRPLSGALSGHYREGVWEFTVRGADDYGAKLLGTAELHGHHLTGNAVVSDLAIPYLTGPLNLALSADGSVDNLPLQLAVTAREALSFRLGEVGLDTDLRGELRATLSDGQLTGEGELGTLRLSGRMSLQPGEVALDYRLSDTPLAGLVSGSLALEGRLMLDSAGPTATAALRGSQLALGPVALPALDGLLVVAGGDLALTAPALGLTLTLQEGRSRLALEKTQLLLANQVVTITGSAEAALSDLGSATFALTAESEQLALHTQGSAAQAELALTAAPGLTLAPLRLEGVTLLGEMRLQQGQAALHGALGGLAVDVSALLFSPWRLEVALSGEGETLVAMLSAERWTLNGALPLGGLLDLPLAGRLQAGLSGSAAGFHGAASVTGSYAQQPFSAALRGEGEFIAATLEAVTGGVPLTLTGAVFPTLDATLAAAEFGVVAISGNLNDVQATGSGTLNLSVAAGLKLPPEAWTLRASLAEQQAELTVGASQATLIWQADSWRLAATVAQEALWQGLPLALSATVAASSGDPGLVRGQLSLAGQPLALAGTLDGVALHGTLAVPPLAAALGAPELDGTLTVAGQLQPLGPTYALEALWSLETSELAIHVSGSGGTLQGRAQTAGFAARYDSGGLIAVSAAGGSLGPFLPVDASVTGDLTFDPTLELWSGALTAVATPFTLTLHGDGPRLVAGLTAVTEAYQLNAYGPVSPIQELAVSAEAEFASFSGSLRGAHNDAALQGDLVIIPPAGAGIASGPLSAGVQGRWRGSLEASELRVQGEVIDLQLQRGMWSGGVDLGVAVQGAAHALRVAVSGALNDPWLHGVLSGPLISGEISGPPLSAPLSLAVAAQLDPRLSLSAEGVIDQQGVWQASGAIEGQLADLPLTGEIAGSGKLANFQAQGEVSLGGQPLPLRLTGDGALIRASTEGSLDLAALSTFLPMALSGTLGGSASAAIGPGGFDYRLELATHGTVAGQAFALTASAETHGLTVQGEVFGSQVALSGDLSRLQLDLSGPEALTFSATAMLDEELTVQGNGSFRGQPLAVALRLKPASLTGQGSIHYGTARLEWESASELEATLSWPLWPDPIRARLERAEGGFALLLSTQEFTLTGQFNSDLALTAWQSSGRLEAPWWGAALEGGLQWQAASGFMGQASASLAVATASPAAVATASPAAVATASPAAVATASPAALAGLKLNLALQGDTTLSVTGAAALEGRPLANLALRLSQTPWRDPRLAGGLRLNAPLSQWLASRDLWLRLGASPIWPTGHDLWLSGDITLLGTLTAPQVSGPLRLAGAVEAQGSLTGGLSGAELLLTGPALSLAARADPQGWELSATASALPLPLAVAIASPFGLSLRGEPLADAQASAVVVGSQRWGEAPHLRVSELTLRQRQSLLSGWLEYRDRWQGTLTLDLNLADLTPLRGRLHGPLTVAGESLAGAWQLDALGLPGADWGLSGTALLGGTGAAPQLTLSLLGEGSAQGQLQLAVEGLAIATAKPQLTVLRGSGRLAWGELGLRLEDGDPAGQRLELLGDGRLAGWRFYLAPGEAIARLSGDLASLGAGGAGELMMALDWRDTAPAWLSGTLQGGALSGVALGDMTITAAGDTLRLDGERVSGALALSDLSWQGRLDLTLPGGLDLYASLQGVADQAELSATFSTTLFGEAVALPVSAAYRAGRASAWADTPLLGGRLMLEVHHDNGWQGSLAITEVALAGAQLTASGDLSGQLSEPRLSGQLSLAAGADTRLSGTFEAGPAGVSVAQQLSSTLLATPLSLAGTLAPRLELRLASESEVLWLSHQDQLRAEGSLSLSLPGALLTLTPSTQPTGWLDLELALDAGLALAGTLPQAPAELAGGWALQGIGATSGALELNLAERAVSIRDLAWRSPVGSVALTGRLSLDGQGTLSGRWQSDLYSGPDWLTEADFPFELAVAVASPVAVAVASPVSVAQESALLTLASPLGSGRLTLSWREALQAEAALALQLGEGGVRLELSYHQAQGPQGHLELTQVPVWGQDDGAIALSGSFALEPTGVTGTGRIITGTETPFQGSLEVSAALGWMRLLPGLAGYLPGAASHTLVQLRIDSLELSALPGLSQRLPHLHAPVSGMLQLRDTVVTGQLVSPELQVLEQALPGTLELAGTLERLEARGSLGSSQLSATLSGNHLEGLLNLRDFPLQVLAEAAVGETGVYASATALARFSLPLNDPASGVLRVASERILLKRDLAVATASPLAVATASPLAVATASPGIVTEGEVAFRYDEAGLFIETAEFRGDGQWQAEGEFTPTGIDFRLQADEANFTPLLGLFPAFAEWQVGARGSLTLTAGGTLAAPRVSLASPSLDLAVSGTNYRLDGLSARLEGGQLTAAAQLWGLDPVTGKLAINARGSLVETLQVSFSGAAEVPLVGSITNLAGELHSAGGAWTIAGEGSLGNRFTFGGRLNPLQLQLAGTRLTLSAPALLVAQAEADVALGLRYEDAFLLTGEITSHRTCLALGAMGPIGGRYSEPLGNEPPAVVVRSEAANPALGGRYSEPLERIRFDNLIVRAPQQVQFRSNIGNADLSVDLTVGGSAAQLELQGTAQTIRGAFRFGGVDFNVTRGVASFEPSRGAYPVIELRAEASFDKLRALSGLGGRYELAAPREGRSFQVVLEVRGEFEEVAPRTFRLVLAPTLSSNALLQEVGNGGGGPRPLSSDELLALLTLGRLEVDPQLTGSLVGSVAQSAFDTALDLFVLSELQGALGQALGVALLEIRTTALSGLFDAAPPDFGASLRVGGYLSEELFASFSVGRGQAFALRNEFSLHYELGPLALVLRGGVNLLNDQRLTPIPEFGLSLGYALSPLANLEIGLGISSLRQHLSFGINLRW